VILTRAEHSISRRDIDENALRVLYRLSSHGYHAYLVGGGVRDLLLGKKPKDYDVGTDARPSRLKKIFRNCRIIGRRFRIAHVFFPNGQIIEVSTFRRGAQRVIKTQNGSFISDNEYGTPREDALRRDITINGLFYDIESFSVIDYVGGVQDLKDRIIRTISDPEPSFLEDPVRMIRVQRHAARTGFQIEASTLQAIFRHRQEIRTANTARLLEEMLKDLKGGAAEPFFRLMMETHLLDSLLPQHAAQLREHGPEHPFWRRMRALDRRVQEGATYTNAVLLSALLHTILFPTQEIWNGSRNHPGDVWRHMTSSWREISKTIRIARRDTERMAQILISFRKLVQSMDRGKLLPALMRKPYLSEALDFFEIDLLSRGGTPEPITEWRQYAPRPPAQEPRYRFAVDDDRGPPLGPDLLDELEGEGDEPGGRTEPRHEGPRREAGGPDGFGAGLTEGPRRRRRRKRGGRRRRRPEGS
jgi:poly(A) polymerase